MGRAQTLKFVMLDRPEQLGLRLQRQLPNLVQAKGGTVGDLEPAYLPGIGAGKCPFSRPNNSLSIKLAGRAAQLTVISGRSLRGLILWMAAAISSFPVPVSPRMRTVVFVGATCSAR